MLGHSGRGARRYRHVIHSVFYGEVALGQAIEINPAVERELSFGYFADVPIQHRHGIRNDGSCVIHAWPFGTRGAKVFVWLSIGKVLCCMGISPATVRRIPRIAFAKSSWNAPISSPLAVYCVIHAWPFGTRGAKVFVWLSIGKVAKRKLSLDCRLWSGRAQEDR
jgi:hypothetical protein